MRESLYFCFLAVLFLYWFEDGCEKLEKGVTNIQSMVLPHISVNQSDGSPSISLSYMHSYTVAI